MTAPQIENGMRFGSRKACTAFVQDVALSAGRRAIIDGKSSGGNNFAFRCNSETPCSFFVKVSKCRGKNSSGFSITSCETNHYGCTGQPKVTLRQAAKSSGARSLVMAALTVPAAVLQADVNSLEEVHIPQRMAYRVIETITGDVIGNYTLDFQHIHSFLSLFCQLNPTSFFRFRTTQNNRFDRAFISHPYAANLQRYGQKVLGKQIIILY